MIYVMQGIKLPSHLRVQARQVWQRFPPVDFDYWLLTHYFRVVGEGDSLQFAEQGDNLWAYESPELAVTR